MFFFLFANLLIVIINLFSGTNETNETDGFKLVGKNYDPETRAPRIGFDEPPTVRLQTGETVELVSQQLESATLEKLKSKGISSSDNGQQTLDLESLQPKRANWDLKRDIEPQLKLLEAHTQNAIVKMVRDRLKTEVSTSIDNE